jgi:hypothetical protein
MSTEEVQTAVPAEPTDTFDFEKLREELSKNLNSVGSVVQSSCLKFISYNVSAQELDKDKDDKDKESIAKLVSKLLKTRAFLESSAKDLAALNKKLSSLADV